ncbi:hypothetical protein JNUCC0626_18355 [Lentzea sp. JNUCC 0626]|uniref:hypothetical protein n=1 Tax=Lentzea sp. JNUCC 0626 TaxID=3367513 RepID=UPI0037491C66
MFKRTDTPTAVAPASIEQTFSVASGASAAAKSTFTTTIDDLKTANAGFAAVEVDTEAEIARLQILRQEAISQREVNEAVIARLQDLVGV